MSGNARRRNRAANRREKDASAPRKQAAALVGAIDRSRRQVVRLEEPWASFATFRQVEAELNAALARAIPQPRGRINLMIYGRALAQAQLWILANATPVAETKH